MIKIASVLLSSGDVLAIWLDGSITPKLNTQEFKDIKELYDNLANDGCPDVANRFVWGAHILSEMKQNVTFLVDIMTDSGDIAEIKS